MSRKKGRQRNGRVLLDLQSETGALAWNMAVNSAIATPLPWGGNAVAPNFSIEAALDAQMALWPQLVGNALICEEIECDFRVMLYDVAAALAVHADPATPSISFWNVCTDWGLVPNVLGGTAAVGADDEEAVTHICSNALNLAPRAIKMLKRLPYRPQSLVMEMGPVTGGAEQWSQYWTGSFKFQIPNDWTHRGFRSRLGPFDSTDDRMMNFLVCLLRLPGLNAFTVNTFSVHMRQTLRAKVLPEGKTLGEVLN